ncbi:MAG: ROK family protein [Thermaerobacter sp.]|nr:ROK family protein [Thermaerobacter sp.]
MAFLLENGFRYPNQRMVFRKIRESGVVTRRQLMQQTDLSFQTVSNIVAELSDTALVLSDGLANQSAGKRAELLKVNPDGLYAVGVLLDRAGLEAVLIDLLGNCRIQQRMPFSSSHPDAVLRQMADITQRFLAEARVSPERFAGVGISTPGPIDFRTGAVSRPPNFPEWTFVPLQQRLGDMLGCPVTLFKDSHAAALAEIWALNNAVPSSFFYLYFSAGIGGALVVDRRVWTGFSGNAGEIGHVAVAPSPGCDCGRTGCLEAVWSLSRLASEAGVSVEEYAQSIAYGSESYLANWLQGIPWLARAVVDAANVIEPEALVIGGPQGQAVGPSLIAPLSEALQREGFVHNLRPMLVRAASAQNAAGIGAGLMRLNAALAPDIGLPATLGLDI